MNLQKEECIHISQVLEQVKEALKNLDSIKLKSLSNQTIHDACSDQDSASTTIAVMLYALSKLIERRDYKNIKSWNTLIKKFNSVLDLTILALNQNRMELYLQYVQEARQVLTSQSVTIKPYIQEILKKASINKGGKIHEHGVSLEQTSKILGISQWELSDYIGQTSGKDIFPTETINTKTRAKRALEFFS